MWVPEGNLKRHRTRSYTAEDFVCASSQVALAPRLVPFKWVFWENPREIVEILPERCPPLLRDLFIKMVLFRGVRVFPSLPFSGGCWVPWTSHPWVRHCRPISHGPSCMAREAFGKLFHPFCPCTWGEISFSLMGRGKAFSRFSAGKLLLREGYFLFPVLSSSIFSFFLQKTSSSFR